MTLDILTKRTNLHWTEDNQQYAHFKAWRKRVEMLITGMVLKKEPQEFICHCIKAWSGNYTHIEAVGLMDDYANSTKCLLDTLKGHQKPRSNEIVVVKLTNNWYKGTLVCQCTYKCREVTATCNFGIAYDKCLQNAILLGLTSADVIQITSEV